MVPVSQKDRKEKEKENEEEEEEEEEEGGQQPPPLQTRPNNPSAGDDLPRAKNRER